MAGQQADFRLGQLSLRLSRIELPSLSGRGLVSTRGLHKAPPNILPMSNIARTCPNLIFLPFSGHFLVSSGGRISPAGVYGRRSMLKNHREMEGFLIFGWSKNTDRGRARIEHKLRLETISKLVDAASCRYTSGKMPLLLVVCRF